MENPNEKYTQYQKDGIAELKNQKDLVLSSPITYKDQLIKLRLIEDVEELNSRLDNVAKVHFEEVCKKAGV